MTTTMPISNLKPMNPSVMLIMLKRILIILILASFTSNTWAQVQIFNVSGGGTYCANTSPSNILINLSGSEKRVNYILKHNGTLLWETAFPGTGGPYSFSVPTAAGTYQVVAQVDGSDDFPLMNGQATFILNPVPEVYYISGGGSYFEEDGGVQLGLSNSQSGIRYYLSNGSTNLVAKNGNGGAISFGTFTSGTYKVKAKNTSTGCELVYSERKTVSLLSSPAMFSVNEGLYCAGEQISTVELNGSEVGVEYFLQRNGILLSNVSISGTGSPIIFRLRPSLGIPMEGRFKIVAKLGTDLFRTMSGEVSIFDPPVVDVGPDLEIFNGESIDLIGSPSGGIWTGNYVSNGKFNPQSAPLGLNTVTYSYTDPQTGCSNSKVKGFNIWDLPNVSASGPTAIYNGESVTLFVEDLYEDYVWFKNGDIISGANSNAIFVSESGRYKVKISIADDEYITNEVLVDVSGPNINNNFVYTKTYQTPTSSISTNQIVNENVDYFDGLGRPLQSISLKSSPAENDVIVPFTYDEFGRKSHEYLPYVSEDRTLNFRTNVFGLNSYSGGEHQRFYENTNKVAPDSRPFSEIVYEGNPLDRIVKKYGPGESWKNGSVDKPIEFEYQLNGSSNVMLFNLIGDSFEFTDFYTQKSLYKTSTIDESSHSVIEYKNKKGNVILKRVQASEGGFDWAETYYIYDDLNNLAYVLSPEGSNLVKSLTHPAIISSDIKDKWCFQYKYDSENRLVKKKVPGADWVYMIYDDRDRLVLTQDGNQRTNNEWLFTKYDFLNRPILTGKYTNTTQTSLSDMQALVNDFYNNAAGTQTWFETEGTERHGYTNTSFPTAPIDEDYLTVNYYNNYEFLNNPEWQSNDYSFSNPDEITSVETNGTSDYIALHKYYDQAEQITALTAEAWVNTTCSDGTSNWAVMDFDRSDYFQFTITGNGQVQFSSKSPSKLDDHYSVRNDLNDGTWHHIAVVYDGTDKRIYIDGVLDSTKPNVHNGEGIGIGSVRYGFIGDGSEADVFDGNRNNSYFQGKIGEVRLWNTVRTAQQIAEYRDVPLTGNEIGLEGFWTMDDRSTTLEDHTGNGGDGEFRNIDESAYQSEIQQNGLPLEKFDKVKGMLTGSKVKASNGAWLKSVSYYDKKYRTIQSIGDNILGGTDRSTLYYDFVGKVIKSISDHNNGTDAKRIQRHFTYDRTGRLIDTYHQLNSLEEVLLSHNEYNELGELVDKKLHSDDGTDFEQSVDFRYNIRGWLTSINNAWLGTGSTNDDTDDFWGMNLSYNDNMNGLNTPLYNGNISSVKWSGEDNAVSYVYDYDAMNRISNAQYYDKSTGGWSHSGLFDLNDINYDFNGNITDLTRSGDGNVIDQLGYTYEGNQLGKVDDSSGSEVGFKDGVNSGNDYDYDVNGNMIADLNKDIDYIGYNHLNLPDSVHKKTGEYIKYIYDAAGIKLAQEVYDAGDVLQKRTDYVGEFIYETDSVGNTELALIQHEEGRIVPEEFNGGYEYQYHLKDHLGNTRVTFTTKPKTFDFTLNYEGSTVDSDDADMFEELNNIIPADVHDYVDAANESFNHDKVQALNGSTNGVIGSVLTIPVGKGDKINASVYAKYLAPTGTANPTAAVGSLLLAALTGNTGTLNYEGSINSSYSTSGSMVTNMYGDDLDDTRPHAFINLLFLPEDVTAIPRISYGQIPESSSNAMSLMSLPDEYEAPSAGYIVVYLSNESANLTNVYFDDLKVTVNEHPVIQRDDYYPFGLAFNSWQRSTTAKENRFKYNGKELVDDLNLGIYDFGVRFYDPSIARWCSMDPAADLMQEWSPYNYTFDNPLKYIDPDGAIPWPIEEKYNNYNRKSKPDDYFGNPRTGQGYSEDYSHAGVDLNFDGGGNTDKGAPVLATHAGKVVEVRKYTDHNNSAGTYIKIQAPDGSFQTVYMHLDEASVKEGDVVSEGQQIGSLGGSGFGKANAHTAHLHYEIRSKDENGIYASINPQDSNGDMIDPQNWIDNPLEVKIMNIEGSINNSINKIDNLKSKIEGRKKSGRDVGNLEKRLAIAQGWLEVKQNILSALQSLKSE